MVPESHSYLDWKALLSKFLNFVGPQALQYAKFRVKVFYFNIFVAINIFSNLVIFFKCIRTTAG